MTDLSGKVVVVTGASSGIGKAIAEALVKVGSKVIGCSRNIEKLQKIASLLNSDGPGKMFPFKCDVSVEEDIIKLFQFVKEEFESLQAIINNAGIIEFEPLLTGESEAWMRMLKVNFLGAAMFTREGIRLMRKFGVDDGHVVFMNSTFGKTVSNIPKYHFYMATKFALSALSEGLRQELRAEKSHIRVTSIYPSLTNTNIIEQIRKDDATYLEWILSAMTPLKPEDVAANVIHVLTAPRTVDINDITIRPYDQES